MTRTNTKVLISSHIKEPEFEIHLADKYCFNLLLTDADHLGDLVLFQIQGLFVKVAILCIFLLMSLCLQFFYTLYHISVNSLN